MKNTCRLENCSKNVAAYDYCQTHAAQIRRHGKLTPKTRLSPTEFIVLGKITKVSLRNNTGAIVSWALIDTEDWGKVSLYKWSLTSNKYISGISKGRRVYLHRLITGAPKGMVINHKDFDPLNNTKDNLHVCEQWQNVAYRRKSRGKHEFKGVILAANKKSWTAKITCQGNNLRVSKLTSATEAAYIYDQFALQLLDEFALTNFSY